MNYVENLSERCVLQLMMRMNVFQRTELMNENICTLEIKKNFFLRKQISISVWLMHIDELFFFFLKRLECHGKSRLVTHIFNHRQKNVIERINNGKLKTKIKSKNYVVNKTFKYKCTLNIWQMLSVRVFQKYASSDRLTDS